MISFQYRFEYPNLEFYDWPRLDRLICGLEPRFQHSLRYWCTRFLVVPTPIPDRSIILGSQGDMPVDSSDEVRCPEDLNFRALNLLTRD